MNNRKLKAFDFFACGGGASIGIQNAGFELIGFNEIDPKIAKFHKTNIPNTKYDYICDIRDMLTMDLPEEMYDLDLVHCSFPCSSFSTSGAREKLWGKKKKFAEGQKEQTLDDLGFISCEMIAKLKPKVVTMENVKGLLIGRAKTLYLDKILQKLRDIDYVVECSIINATTFDVPQNRERLVIIAQRKDIFKEYVNILNEPKKIPLSTILDMNDKDSVPLGKQHQFIWEHKKYSDKQGSDVFAREQNKPNYMFNVSILHSENTCQTITAKGKLLILYDYPRYLNIKELVKAQTFPEDYDFLGEKYLKIHFIIGMSVPPKMMEGICKEIKKKVFNM